MDEGARSRIPRDDERTVAPNFVTAAVDRDLESGRVDRVVTRFPPEPNGYLHIGHAKAICLDFGVAEDYGGVTYLRLDDTNPIQEDPAFVDAIQRDVAWLGFTWIDVRHASDYFERLYELARTLIRRGEAYVDGQDLDTIRATRGTVTTPGTPSPDRDRPPEESLALFDAMRRGEHPEGAYVLRAKIDMASPNMILRDPVLYRILHAPHHRTGDAWHVYPMYDFAHPLSDAIEGSRTASAPSSSRTTARSTTGSSNASSTNPSPGSTSSTASSWTTPSSANASSRRSSSRGASTAGTTPASRPSRRCVGGA